MGDLRLFTPEFVVLAGTLMAFAMSAIEVSKRWAWRVSIHMGAIALGASAMFLLSEGQPFFNGIYSVDVFSQLLKFGIVAGLFLTLLLCERSGSLRDEAYVDVPIFLFISTLGMMMLVSATELLTLYVALELSAYGMYIMAALHRLRKDGSEAAAKYILFGGASSAVTLYGISLIYGATGSTYLSAIPAAGMSPLLIVGGLLALAGLAFKLALFPFHAWAPDTYEGAPHQVVTFIATASKVAAVGVLIRILVPFAKDPQQIKIALLVLCVASMTFGNLAAIAQRDVKRLLAYSTVAHAGYIAIGLASFTELGFAAAIFYALIYVPISFCAFLVVTAVGSDGRNPKFEDMAGLYQRSPLLAATLLIGLFGLAGIPPTAGFIGKWFLFVAALDGAMFWLVFVAAVNATISLYYYLRLLKEAYLTPPGDRPAIRLPDGVAVAACIGMVLVLVAGVYPGPLWDVSGEAARAVMGIDLFLEFKP